MSRAARLLDNSRGKQQAGATGLADFSGDSFSMTWKRVATAAVLIPFAVGLVLWGSTALLAVAVALVTLLALFEYFALGEAIGHRAYRFWTASCSLLLFSVQWLVGEQAALSL